MSVLRATRSNPTRTHGQSPANKAQRSSGFAPTNDITGKEFKSLAELQNFVGKKKEVYLKSSGSFLVKGLQVKGFNKDTPFTALHPRGDKNTSGIYVKNGQPDGASDVLTLVGANKKTFKVKVVVAYSAS